MEASRSKYQYIIISVAIIFIVTFLPTLFNSFGYDFGSVKTEIDYLQIPDILKDKTEGTLLYHISGHLAHNLFEWTAFCLALAIGFVVISHYMSKKDGIILILALAFFCTGLIDAFHILASDQFIEVHADNEDFIPFSWSLGRIVNALALSLGLLVAIIMKQRKVKVGLLYISGCTIFFALAVFSVIYYCLTTPNLPESVFPQQILKHPIDVIPLLAYLGIGLPLSTMLYLRHPNLFTLSILLAFIPNVFIQIHMAFGSSSLYDNHFNIAHFLKVIAYLIPFIGLCLEYMINYKEKENQYQELANEKQQENIANLAKTKFLSNMSHEIRTPISGLIGMCEILLESDLTKEQKIYAKNISLSAEALLNLINDILDQSKLETDKLQLNIRSFDIKSLVNDSCDLLALAAQDKNLDFIVHIQPDIPRFVIGDPARIRQILTNLISNSIKSTSEGYVLVSIVAVQIEKNSYQYMIEVKDSGMGLPYMNSGIPHNNNNNSFSRMFGSTGLGLSIANGLVEKMNGQLLISSERGKGSIFSVYLPLRIDRTKLIEKEQETSLKDIKVLLVDDSELSIRALESMLTSLGIKTKTANTPEKFLSYLESGYPCDVILIDYFMPTINGIELAKKIQEYPYIKDDPKILLSSKRFAKKTWSKYFDNCLFKPIRTSNLKSAIQDAITRKS